jgi:uncharacterized protein
MKKIVFVFSVIILMVGGISAQDNGVASKDYIQVRGTSELEIVPDEIYITINLLERMDGKEKISIEKQEGELKKHLKELGIDISNLTLNSANADYGKVRWATKDVLIRKSYLLKVGDADMLSKVFERLDQMNAKDAYVSKFTHSKILEYQKENRIKALKAAKEKIDYLLAALDQKAGKAIEINENENYVQSNEGNLRSMSMNKVASYGDNRFLDEDSEEISFKKIKIRSSFLVKYEILNK